MEKLLFLGEWTPALSNGQMIIAAVTLVGLMGLLINYLRAGKNGWSWHVVLAVLTVLFFLVRIFVSVFREIASTGETGGWDD